MAALFAPGTFPGRVVLRREAAGFRFIETAYRPGAHVPPHLHDQACFCLVVNGSFREVYENKARMGTPSLLIYRPAGERHEERFQDAGGHCLNIDIPEHRLDLVGQEGFLRDDSAQFEAPAVADLGLRLYREFQSRDAASSLAIEGLALELLSCALRVRQRPSLEGRSPYPPRWLLSVRELLQDRFSEGLSLAEIAATAGVHPVHLSAAFRRQYGCTVGEYVRELRVQWACRALANSDTPLPEVALAAGFSDQSHFSRAIKRATGMTPVQYRRAVGRRLP